ncbi:hypothetical protein AHF37_05739 [Paragonimus kellicotti]|nr:hypothetical protein AHF37_05739 [Paragonimus kellicotti]
MLRPYSLYIHSGCEVVTFYFPSPFCQTLRVSGDLRVPRNHLTLLSDPRCDYTVVSLLGFRKPLVHNIGVPVLQWSMLHCRVCHGSSSQLFLPSGVINGGNIQAYSQIYNYDNVVYTPKECVPCSHVIPARARHCGKRLYK